MNSQSARPKVVIVGGGFGGLYAAKGLANKPGDVTRVDRKDNLTLAVITINGWNRIAVSSRAVPAGKTSADLAASATH